MEDYSEPLDLSLPSVKLKNRQSQSDLPLDLSKKRIDNPQIQLGPYSNSIMKNVPNFSCDKRSRLHQSCGPPNMAYINKSKPRNAHSCIPVRNPYPDNYEDELDSEETPFNFSHRYSETKTINGQKIHCSSGNFKDEKMKNRNGNFAIYAETDLDQPTDYSLRYAENNRESDGDESEESDSEEKTNAAEFVGDSVKTYCTEGTPYETPFNFSTSTSMSDLRIAEKGAADVVEIGSRKRKIEENIPENDISDKILEEVGAEQPQTPKIKSEFNSGLTSPEKPMNYCEEGTPGYFSRVSSFGSLNSAAAGSGEEKLSDDKDKCEEQIKTPKTDKMQQKMPGSEVKVVKFENIVNYCEETPLMFSRSSSLGSLDSIEQSMNDDRSSVISDFSRLTSGIISPSEIPDSPTQTVPPSPKQRKSSDFGLISRRQCPARRSLPTKSSIFEDGVTKFKEESTPAQFSVATSLSSLNIDDQDDNQLQNGSDQNCVNVSKNQEQDCDINVDKLSSHDEADGISFNNKRENMQNRCFPSSKNRQFQSKMRDSASTAYDEGRSMFSSLALPPPLTSENNVHTYNTEDTPAVLSRNGSISELSLSTLSILDEEHTSNRVYLSEDGSDSSGDQKNNVQTKKSSKDTTESADVWLRREAVKQPESKLYRQIDNLPPFLESRDECCAFAVEDSPAQFSLRSSLSHLTMESEVASGFLDFSTSKETPVSPSQSQNSNQGNGSQQHLEVSTNAEEREEEKISKDVKIQESEIAEENISFYCANEEENIETSGENSKSLDLKSDDSRCNSMKKRKWKWKWQFGSEDGQQSESGESTLTDKQLSSNIEEFDQGRRGRGDKAGSLDASLRKKKWWKWKFGSKEKETVGTQERKETIEQGENQKSNNLQEDESQTKENSSLDTRSKSKRWKWKWKLVFKDDESSKPEKSSSGLSKLKNHVSPETAKEPISIADVLQSSNVPKEMNSLKRFLPDKGATVGVEPQECRDIGGMITNERRECIPVPAREKLATPEPSDSEHSVIIEEINEHHSSEDEPIHKNRNKLNVGCTSERMRRDNNDKPGINSHSIRQVDYATSLEECIQLGMPKSKNYQLKTPSHVYSPNSRNSPKETSSQISSKTDQASFKTATKTGGHDLKDFLEECIQKGMPKNKIPSEKTAPFNNSYYSRSSPQRTSGRFKPDPIEENNNRGSTEENKRNNSTRSIPTHQALRNANRTANYDSSSLNRFPLDKTRRKVFHSNDNILTNDPKPILQKPAEPYAKALGQERGINRNKTEGTCGEIEEFPNKTKNGKLGPKETYNSQLNRTVSRILDSSSSSSRSDNYLPTPKTTDLNHKESSYLTTSGKNRDYATLVEECIQLGMPKKKEPSKETSSPKSLVHQKMVQAKKWPEYLSNITNENKSASLPKSSSNHTPQSNCLSNEDITAPNVQIKRDLVLQRTLEKNFNRFERPQSVIPEKKQERILHPIPDERTTSKYNHLEGSQKMKKCEESLYANVDETRNYLKPALDKEPSYSYESLSNDKIIKPRVELASNRDRIDHTSTLVEDFIKLGIPIKKIKEIQRSLDRSNSQEIVTKYEVRDVPARADSDDEAVYANTTERYSTFRNPAKPEDAKRSEEKPLSPKSYDVREASISTITSERKFVPPATHKNWKNDARMDNLGKISKKETEIVPKNNQDFAAIIEECIQLGMPKRKELSGDMLNSNLSLSSTNSRSNSVTRYMEYPQKGSNESHRSSTLPKNSTYSSNPQNYYSSKEDLGRPGSRRQKSVVKPDTNRSGDHSQEKNLMNVSRKEQTNILKSTPQARSSTKKDFTSSQAANLLSDNLEKNENLSEIVQKEEDPEQSLYVNVSKHAEYSRSVSRQSPSVEIMSLTSLSSVKSNSSQIGTNCGENYYSAVLEECIKLGMPPKKTSESQKAQKNINTPVVDPEDSSIKFGSPSSMDSEEMQLYINTSGRFSNIKDSSSERGFDRFSRGTVLSNSLRILGANKVDVDPPSGTIEKALEECIQLGWPKRKDSGKDPPVKLTNKPSVDPSIRRNEKSVSKNVNVASVVRNMQLHQVACSKALAMTTGAEASLERQNAFMTDEEKILRDKEKNGYKRPVSENSTVLVHKTSFESKDNHAESEKSFASLADIDVKLLDPQLMLQSLEKYTAKLISEAEVLINSKSLTA